MIIGRYFFIEDVDMANEDDDENLDNGDGVDGGNEVDEDGNGELAEDHGESDDTANSAKKRKRGRHGKQRGEDSDVKPAQKRRKVEKEVDDSPTVPAGRRDFSGTTSEEICEELGYVNPELEFDDDEMRQYTNYKVILSMKKLNVHYVGK